MDYNCVSKLCEFLNCSDAQLSTLLRDDIVCKKVVDYLKGFDLFLRMPGVYFHKPKQIIIDGISKRDATRIYLYGGYLRINIQQHYYEIYRKKLRMPDLQCIRMKCGSKYSYYPMECVVLKDKEDSQESE